MSFFKHFDWSFKSIAKGLGLLLLGVVVVSVVIALVTFSFRTILSGGYDSYNNGYDDLAYEKTGAPAMTLSERSFISPRYKPPAPRRPDYSSGTDAEAYEIKEYTGRIKTRHLDRECQKILELKAKETVIFESSNQGDERCVFRFKVKNENARDIVAFIESLKPEYFNENIHTIKATLDQYDSELDILNKKLASIEATLGNAQKAYDELSTLATRKQDVETLATIIDRKLNLIEKLSTERLSVKEQIDRFSKEKAEQLDRLEFTFFNVTVLKDLIVDWKQIKDSWKYEVKRFVDNFNQVVQGLTVSLGTYLIRLTQVLIYLFLSLFVIKLAWITGKKVWRGKRSR